MRCSALALAGLILAATPALQRPPASGDELLEQRRARLEKMTDAEKTRLLEKKRRFDEFSRTQQKQFRQLHQELVQDKDYERLRETLQRYSDWLKTLTSLDRAELSKLPVQERLARVKELMDAQAKDRFRQMLSEASASQELLSHEDLDVICIWTDQFLKNHAQEILDAVKGFPFVDDGWAKLDPDKQVHVLRFIYFRGGSPFRRSSPRGPGSSGKGFGKGDDPEKSVNEDYVAKLPKPTPEEVEALVGRVSAPAREALGSVTDETERLQMIRNWMRAAAFSRFRPPVSREELDRFIREGGVTREEREWLESLPHDRVFHELRRLYYRKRFQGGRGGGGGGGRWGGFPGGGGRDGKSREGSPRGGRGGPGRQNRPDDSERK